MKKIILLVMATFIITAQGYPYFCPEILVYNRFEERSFCNVTVRFLGPEGEWRNFNERHQSFHGPYAEQDCYTAERRAERSCDNYRRYEHDGEGDCRLDHYNCMDYIFR